MAVPLFIVNLWQGTKPCAVRGRCANYRRTGVVRVCILSQRPEILFSPILWLTTFNDDVLFAHAHVLQDVRVNSPQKSALRTC